MAQRLSNLPLGALIKFGSHVVNKEAAQPIIWRVVDKNHQGYPANSVTLITDKIIDVRCYDNREIENESSPNGTVNYDYSNIHQWLTSTASAGQWYTAKHSYDRPPDSKEGGYSALPGFLYNFTANERAALLPTTVVCQTNTDISKTVVAKIFIPTLWEIGGSHSIADGTSALAYFINGERTATVTTQAFTYNTLIDKPTSTTTPYMYMTRSSSGKYIYDVNANGTWGSATPNHTRGVRPCMNLSNNTKISDTTDSDGCYTVLYNTNPVISGSNSNLGTKTDGFTQNYTITDADSDAVTVTEYIDDVKVRSYVATLGVANTFDVRNKTWLVLPNGNHTLKIVANDGFAEMTRTFTFTKSITQLVVQRTEPIISNGRVQSILVTVVKNIPEGAIFKVEACNNAFDASPTWEDITTRVVQGRIYDFTNIASTSGKWGVNIRVTVDRNGASGACYITEIGGNFE